MDSEKTDATGPVNLSGTVFLDTFDLQMKLPGTNKPSGWVVTLAGPAHPQTIALANDAERDRLKKAADIERAQVNGRKYKGDEDMDPNDSRRKFVAGVVGRIITWSPVDFGNGAIAFSRDAAVALFMDPAKGGYYVQLVDYLTSEKAFIPASQTT